jgi:ABC-type branched-subunit amino acid transport system ATPase component
MLEVENLFANWGSGEVAAHGRDRTISFSLLGGDWLALLGPNGCGKTTLLNALLGTISIRSGIVKLNKVNITDTRFAWESGLRIVLVSQHAALNSSQSIGDLLPFVNRKRVDSLADFEQLIIDLAHGSGVKPGHCENRMWELCAALIARPDLLLLDEIGAFFTSREEKQELYSKIKRLLPETIVIFVEHDLKIALEACSCVLVLRDAKDGDNMFTRHPVTLADLELEDHSFEDEGDSTSIDSDFSNSIANPDITVRDNLLLALRQLSVERKARSDLSVELLEKFPFLGSHKLTPVQLSGGQRVVLLQCLSLLAGRGAVPERTLGHLFPATRKQVSDVGKIILKAIGS